MMPAAFVMSAGMMGMMSSKMFQQSSCGEEFDEYVYRGVSQPFPFSPAGASSRDLPELWQQRRCKLYLGEKWREGRVCGWTQYNPTDRAMETNWIVYIELDTVEQGDPVELRIQGTVCSNEGQQEENTTNIQVINATTSSGQDSNTIILKPMATSILKPRMKLYVNRLNVHAGGTLKLHSTDDAPLISFEWLEPATPSVNLNESILSFDCPYCRATEPVITAFENSTDIHTSECPVCMDTKPCRVLSCGHDVCHECWNHVCQAAMQVELPELDQEQVLVERKKRNRCLRRKRSRDGPRNDFEERFVDLARNADTMHGLQRLQYELMVEPPCLWAIPQILHYLEDLPVRALKVILQVVESRKDEMSFVSSDDGTTLDPSGDASHFCCYFLARRLRQARDFRAAVPWAELSIYYAKHSNLGQDAESLASAYLFSSEVHALADLLTQSLKDLNTCMELLGSNNSGRRGRESEHEARNMLLEAMKEWTGSSGKLTGGI